MRKMEVLLLLYYSSCSRNSFFEIASDWAELSYQSTFARMHTIYDSIS